MIETLAYAGNRPEAGTLPLDQRRISVTVAGFDSATLLRILTRMAPRNVTLLQLDTVQHEDSSATLAMTVHDPDQWHTRLPLLFDRIINVTGVSTYDAASGEWLAANSGMGHEDA